MRAAWALCILAGGPAFAGEPLIRAELPATPRPVPAGQPIMLDVRVLVPNYFLSAPQFPDSIDLPGAVVTLSDDRAQNLTETIGGQTYSGIRRSYVIVPQRGGQYTLPPTPIGFAYAAEPGKRTQGSVPLPPLRFDAALPAGAEGPDGPLPVVPLTVIQAVDPDQAALKAGDALSRSITISAPGLRAMMIPPPAIEAPAGVTMYRHDPVLSDGSAGRRIDRVTYAFEMPGDYVLPAVEAPWFDLAAGARRVAEAPELRLHVAPGTAPSVIAPPPAAPPRPWYRQVDWRVWGPLAGAPVVAGLLVLAAMRWAPRARAAVLARHEQRARSEPALFTRLLAACGSADRRMAYAALERWASAAGAGPVRRWAVTCDEAGLLPALDALERALFSATAASGVWDGRPLAAALRRGRARWRARRRAAPKRWLPRLNP